MSKLFRQEAIEHQRTRLWGEVLIVQPRSFKWLVGIFFISLCVLVLFASLQNYKRKESVSGYLLPQSGMLKVNSDRGGVISQILVRNGTSVNQGDALIKVTQHRSDDDGSNNSLQTQSSLNKELIASQSFLASIDDRRLEDIKNLKQQLKGKRRELDTFNSELALLEEQLKLVKRQRLGAEQLKSKGFVSQANVDTLLGRELEIRQQYLSMKRGLDNAQLQIANIENQIDIKIPNAFAEEKLNLERRVESLKRELASSKISSAYTITAPASGVVGNFTSHVGSNVQIGRQLLTLMPKDSELIARLLVPSRAAGLIQHGQAVRIQYDAFPYQRFGVFDGQVMEISQSVLTPNEMPVPVNIQEAFYLVDIKLGSQTVTSQGKDIYLKPGMQLKADIILEERSLLEWLFEPILTISGRL
ncbi:HlyD family efflux transporter periplasmic adaptor subunit [uncultured Pseudoteredinibacter sp.]|uniref:HlyD family efflux transporter periplasmic adaptor subunit n=1 Tax=uncultured Pseudoteredinibacter sp. TaxID=1641701 RepID=UPI00262A51ED|nr:HlyD family efflux transporter periplasmic adaptor subunit [uncultured Pseudoteredinibacter sp.]